MLLDALFDGAGSIAVVVDVVSSALGNGCAGGEDGCSTITGEDRVEAIASLVTYARAFALARARSCR